VRGESCGREVQIVLVTGVESGSLAVLRKRKSVLISRLLNIHEVVYHLYNESN
jgi:hypothetical protein